MRKNKTWEVSILGNEPQVQQSEDAIFYTSDTEAFLNFKPTEIDFAFTQATIALLNTDDQSLVSVPAVVNNGVAEYKMTPEVIAHWGNWRAQVIFTNASENFTSGLVSFEVKHYLMDERPPRLEDVQSIGLLVADAREIIQELEAGLANLDTAKYENHIANKANPHAVTKSQVGLGSVQNYGIATQAEAQQGTSNVKNMTPLRVKEAIDSLSTKPYSVNIGNGSAKVFTITHNLGTTDVISACYLDNEEILPAMRKIINANAIQIEFATVWGTNRIKVVVMG